VSAGWPQLPAGPVDAAPPGFVREDVRGEMLAGVLAGIELGTWDRRVAAWLTGLDTSTVLTVASWIARSRSAGPAQ
jgi:hypothetical protein